MVTRLPGPWRGYEPSSEPAPGPSAARPALSTWPRRLWWFTQPGRGVGALCWLHCRRQTAKLQRLRHRPPPGARIAPMSLLHPEHPRCPQVHTFHTPLQALYQLPGPIRLGPHDGGLTLHLWGVGLGLVRASALKAGLGLRPLLFPAPPGLGPPSHGCPELKCHLWVGPPGAQEPEGSQEVGGLKCQIPRGHFQAASPRPSDDVWLHASVSPSEPRERRSPS